MQMKITRVQYCGLPFHILQAENLDSVWFLASEVAYFLGLRPVQAAVQLHCREARALDRYAYHLDGTPYWRSFALAAGGLFDIIPLSDVWRLMVVSPRDDAGQFGEWLRGILKNHPDLAEADPVQRAAALATVPTGGCKGLVFRASVVYYGAETGSLYQAHLDLVEEDSCPGCPECNPTRERLRKWQLPIRALSQVEDGKRYRLTMVPPFSDASESNPEYMIHLQEIEG